MGCICYLISFLLYENKTSDVSNNSLVKYNVSRMRVCLCGCMCVCSVLLSMRKNYSCILSVIFFSFFICKWSGFSSLGSDIKYKLLFWIFPVYTSGKKKKKGRKAIFYVCLYYVYYMYTNDRANVPSVLPPCRVSFVCK